MTDKLTQPRPNVESFDNEQRDRQTDDTNVIYSTKNISTICNHTADVCTLTNTKLIPEIQGSPTVPRGRMATSFTKCEETKLKRTSVDRRQRSHLDPTATVLRGYNLERIRRRRRKQIAETFGKKNFDISGMSYGDFNRNGCKCALVFDPAGRLAYWWSFIVAIAFLYNFWVLVYRSAFDEINATNLTIWLTLDYVADLIYILDILFNIRTGYLDDGVLQTESAKLRRHYMNSTIFYIDCLCLLPLDILYLSFGYKSMLRCSRLVKIYRFWEFLDRTERHTNYPNIVRTVTLLHYLFAIYHWNACLMYMVISNIRNNNWTIESDGEDVFATYLHSLYLSTLTLTTIGGVLMPQSKEEYVFIIIEFVFGLLLFATILGHVANIVTSISAARKEFQGTTLLLLNKLIGRTKHYIVKFTATNNRN